MKKLFQSILVLLLTVSLSGCSSSKINIDSSEPGFIKMSMYYIGHSDNCYKFYHYNKGNMTYLGEFNEKTYNELLDLAQKANLRNQCEFNEEGLKVCEKEEDFVQIKTRNSETKEYEYYIADKTDEFWVKFYHMYQACDGDSKTKSSKQTNSSNCDLSNAKINSEGKLVCE